MEFVRLTPEEFRKFSELIKSIAGIYLKDSKITLLSNRLRARLREKNFKNFDEYYHYVSHSMDQREIDEMLNAVSTNETYFFRNNKHFECITKKIIPGMINKKRTPVRIWSAGCSTGEEPYTIAMALDDEGLLKQNLVTIYASDINTKVLDCAKKGEYDIKKLRVTEDRYIVKYFSQIDKNTFKISDRIKSYVNFGRINLKQDNFKERYDLILCRNVMIYFDKNDQKMIVKKFYDSLNSDSYFIIGHSESLYFINTEFVYEKIFDSPIYYKK